MAFLDVCISTLLGYLGLSHHAAHSLISVGCLIIIYYQLFRLYAAKKETTRLIFDALLVIGPFSIMLVALYAVTISDLSRQLLTVTWVICLVNAQTRVSFMIWSTLVVATSMEACFYVFIAALFKFGKTKAAIYSIVPSAVVVLAYVVWDFSSITGWMSQFADNKAELGLIDTAMLYNRGKALGAILAKHYPLILLATIYFISVAKDSVDRIVVAYGCLSVVHFVLIRGTSWASDYGWPVLLVLAFLTPYAYLTMVRFCHVSRHQTLCLLLLIVLSGFPAALGFFSLLLPNLGSL